MPTDDVNSFPLPAPVAYAIVTLPMVSLFCNPLVVNDTDPAEPLNIAPPYVLFAALAVITNGTGLIVYEYGVENSRSHGPPLIVAIIEYVPAWNGGIVVDG